MCDGDWEHTYGIKLSTIDNPGWALDIQLEDTPLASAPFQTVDIQGTSENDWFFCEKSEFVFRASGGPRNLEDVLKVFLDWAELELRK